MTAGQQGTVTTSALGAVSRALFEALQPLHDALRGPSAFEQLLRDLGHDGTVTAEALAGLDAASAVVDLVSRGEALVDRMEQIDGDDADLAGIVVELVALGQESLAAVDALRDVDGAALHPSLSDPDVWRDLAGALPGHLLVQYLEAEVPLVYAVLRLCGVITDSETSTGTVREVIDGSQVGQLTSDPVGAIRERYGWGASSGFRHQMFVDDVALVLTSLGCEVRTGPARDRFVEQFGAPATDPSNSSDGVAGELILPVVSGLTAAGYADTGIALVPVPARPGGAVDAVVVTNTAAGSAVIEQQIGDGWSVQLPTSLDATALVGLQLTPTGAEMEIDPPDGRAAWIVSGDPSEPWRLLGGLIEVAGVDVEVAIRGPAADAELELSAECRGAALVLSPGEGDSFLGGLIGAEQLRIECSPSLSWSSRAGLVVSGTVGLDVVIPLTVHLGPVLVERLHLVLTGDGDVARLEAGVDATAAIGPVVATASGVGVAVEASADETGRGSLGAFDLRVAFKPPDGVGIGIDVGVVSGGGYLDIDADAGTYEGIVDVEVLGVGISAVVIIETDAPGVDGWSMFFALFLDLPSIQLGFGFTLTGVGGVAGINRTLDPEALGAAVRSGSLDAVLFPQNPIAEAPLIIDTFKAIFPAADGRVVFGPIVRIGWGTPTLVEAELGIVLALPDPVMIAVIGSVTAVLPTPDVDLVAINLDIGGVIDFGAQSLSLSASLHDSHVVGFALSGDMELRANFGGRPEFLMALGGFHPDFVAPAGFPSLGRLRLALSPSPLFEVSFECYLALTSNSVQFGAALDLAAEIAGFGIEGGASFDAMVQFSPFMLSTNLGFYITVKAVGVDLAGVWLDIAVKGPNPWTIDGVARFSVLGFEEQIDVHESIGGRQAEPPIDPVDVRTALTDALSLPEAWTVVTSPSGAGVTVAATAAADGRQLASPDSTLSVGQRIVPLAIDLEHLDEAPIGDYHRFDLEAVKGGLPATGTSVDWFAPASFFDLTPVEAISGPSFEELPCGIDLGGGDPSAGDAVPGSLEYEQILRDPEMGIERLDLDNYRPLQDDVRPLIATAHSQTLSSTNPYAATLDAPRELVDAEYALVEPSTGDELVRHTSWSAARGAATGTATVVVPSWELAS